MLKMLIISSDTCAAAEVLSLFMSSCGDEMIAFFSGCREMRRRGLMAEMSDDNDRQIWQGYTPIYKVKPGIEKCYFVTQE